VATIFRPNCFWNRAHGLVVVGAIEEVVVACQFPETLAFPRGWLLVVGQACFLSLRRPCDHKQPSLPDRIETLGLGTSKRTRNASSPEIFRHRPKSNA